MNTNFFNESKEQSQVKSTIVSKYFGAWAKIMIGSQTKYNRNESKIAYIDLFAGPGRYLDGTDSTPLQVINIALKHEDICQRLITVFNDKDDNNVNSLKGAISRLPNIDKLRYAPTVLNHEVGADIVKIFEDIKLVPTFFFVDPWGYKGLSLQLINSVLKDWGCDCIFFFNYNRINMGINNQFVKEHMNALFGNQRADNLRTQLSNLDPAHRELTIIEELCNAIRSYGPQYILPFRFKDSQGSRTSHHLIFVSKGFKGYEVMKEIMAKESSSAEQGVAKFEYNPTNNNTNQQLLFKLSRPLEELGEMLLKDFAGQSLTMLQVYERHNVDRPFIKKNYKDILIKLENQGIITASPHRRNSFADDVMITFPCLGNP